MEEFTLAFRPNKQLCRFSGNNKRMLSRNNIKSIKAREILDSRGNPTVEVELITEGGAFKSGVPSGASTGKYEAVELRDKNNRYNGKGVLGAIKNIKEVIGPKLLGLDASNQEDIDKMMIDMDGTEDKSRLGANALVGVSMVVCKAGAAGKSTYLWRHIAELAKNNLPPFLPKGAFNVINGGAHASNDLDIQEFMLVSQKESFSQNVQRACEIYHE